MISRGEQRGTERGEGNGETILQRWNRGERPYIKKKNLTNWLKCFGIEVVATSDFGVSFFLEVLQELDF